MDISDPEIVFDDRGVCNHCRRFESRREKVWYPDRAGRQHLDGIVAAIKQESRRRPYDCVIGLSGGLDSSYLAFVARRELDLRLLAVHVDAGWNSELAVRNIENVVNTLGIDLYTDVIDWTEMRDLQRAFLKSSLANQDVPQDHVFVAGLYRQAVHHGIRHVLSGGNFASESILPAEWAYNAMDLKHVMGVHKRFGEIKLRSLPRLGFFWYYFWYPVVRRMTVIRPLNYLPYNTEEAIRTLEREVGFRYYGGKHFESRFTKWQQLYYRPQKFGYDSRRAHLASLVLSGEITREDALARLSADTDYGADQQRSDSEYVRKKLGFSEEEFASLLSAPARTFRDYPSNQWLFALKDELKGWLTDIGINVRPRS